MSSEHGDPSNDPVPGPEAFPISERKYTEEEFANLKPTQSYLAIIHRQDITNCNLNDKIDLLQEDKTNLLVEREKATSKTQLLTIATGLMSTGGALMNFYPKGDFIFNLAACLFLTGVVLQLLAFFRR